MGTTIIFLFLVFFYVQNANCYYNRLFSRNSKKQLNINNFTASVITRDGYKFEEHTVKTEDGYILTVYRLTGKTACKSRPRKHVVFLQHGLLSSSADWVISGPGKALAYILFDKGYDVWLGNARGNTHSRKHLHLNPNMKGFWEFSWHEIGEFDLPAMINHALEVSQASKLHFVGHGQGTTSFFVMGDTRQHMMSKIMSMHALAPIAFMGNSKSPVLRAISPFVFILNKISKLLGPHEFLPSETFLKLAGYWICLNSSPFQDLCANVLFLIGGYDSAQLNRIMLSEIVLFLPAGSSTRQILHYVQGVKSRQFRLYDFGFFENWNRYGKHFPPSYDLSKVSAPVALYYGENDWLAAVKDVQTLASHLPKVVTNFRVPFEKWNHFDFMWGIDARSLVYKKLFCVMKQFEV